MKKIAKTVCGTCNASLDVSELEPMTIFTCPGCGTELSSLGALAHLRFDRILNKKNCFVEYEGFDAKNNIYTNLHCSDGKKCPECLLDNIHVAASSEIEKLLNLTHPNICPIMAFGI